MKTIPWPTMHLIEGIAIGTASAGIKKEGRPDLMVMALSEGSSVAGVFTKNAFCAAPVEICRRHLTRGDIRYFVVNSGNANACTGLEGEQNALSICRKVAEESGLEETQVLPFSTGVIGEQLPVNKIETAIPEVFEQLSESGWLDGAKAIMTTDTQPKGVSVQVEINGQVISVTGIAKGSGMIRPNMATLLAYIATDASVDTGMLNSVLSRAANKSFNRISVDGDTSTNDACMLIATGRSGVKISSEDDKPYQIFEEAVVSVLQQLAKLLIRDAEGASKFVTINVGGGRREAECLQVAYSIAHSPLVKTAMFASDANWGRIVAAIGYSGVEELDAQIVRIWLDDVLIVENGGRAKLYKEELGQAVVEKSDFTITVDLGRGDAKESVWTSDLSHEYVSINADYRS